MPQPGRWRISGTGYGDLTLRGDVQLGGGAHASSSISLPGAGCRAHFFVESGEVRIV